MAFWNKYPYTDFHELNADWIINELVRIEGELEALYERAVHDAVEQANAYTDSTLQAMREQIEQLEHDFGVVEERMDHVEGDFTRLTARVNELQSWLVNYVDAQIVASNARTDAAIEANNNTIISELSEFLNNIQVLNFFTGEQVSIQDMFNYLCMLHITDGITYTVMVVRNKTYTQLAGLNITYTDLVMHGNTLYV